MKYTWPVDQTLLTLDESWYMARNLPRKKKKAVRKKIDEMITKALLTHEWSQSDVENLPHHHEIDELDILFDPDTGPTNESLEEKPQPPKPGSEQ